MTSSDEMEARLHAVLGAFLPKVSETRTTRHVRTLMQCRGFKAALENPANKSLKDCDRRVVDELCRHAQAIVRIIRDDAPRSVLAALPNLAATIELAEQLEDLEHDARAALKVVDDRKMRGPRTKFAQMVEHRASKIFEEHNGASSAHVNFNASTSKSYGCYLEFVCRIFDAMRIDASPDSTIRMRLKGERSAKEIQAHD